MSRSCPPWCLRWPRLACRSWCSRAPAPRPASPTLPLPRRARRSRLRQADVVANADLLLRVRISPAATDAGRQDLALLRPGLALIAFLDPLNEPGSREALAREERHRLLDGADAAHHARAEHGRAVVDGDDRRLQGRAARGEHAAAHVPDADDRGRHHRRRRACSSSAPAWRACRRSPRPDGSARRSRPTTCGRPSKEQVQSLGAKFVELPLEAATPRTRAATRRRRTSRSTAASAR